ncbi:MAG: DUF948 domain-containing protein [Syntrophaceae bacterium]|jgi:uncharacterized protein YoxC|nr:DUF948 domain-containing protein [Syntrophaceae bacterium]HOC58434.1 DUF948 domain-containing protein [Smithellaceae bacterium]HQM45674.1 DUF948 domain-containing protein [Smithellaceae bacterium]
MYLEIGFILFALVLLLLVLFTIPILLKLWRAVSDVTVTLQALNERLPVILKNMEEISNNVNQATSAINEQVQKYKETSERIQLVMSDLAGGMEMIYPLVLQSAFFRKMTNFVAAAKGVKVFWEVFTDKKKVQNEQWPE